MYLNNKLGKKGLTSCLLLAVCSTICMVLLLQIEKNRDLQVLGGYFSGIFVLLLIRFIHDGKLSKQTHFQEYDNLISQLK